MKIESAGYAAVRLITRHWSRSLVIGILIFAIGQPAVAQSGTRSGYASGSGSRSYSRSTPTANGNRTSSSPLSIPNRPNPSVRSYSALLDMNGTRSNSSQNYSTQFRPHLDADQRQRQRQLLTGAQRDYPQLRNNATLQDVPASSTGHPTRFNFYSHYYPALVP